MKPSDNRIKPGIVDLWLGTTIRFINDDHQTTISPADWILREDRKNARHTGDFVRSLGDLTLFGSVEHRWGYDEIVVTFRAWNSKNTDPIANLPLRNLTCRVEQAGPWNTPKGPSVVFPFAKPWGQTVTDYFQPRVDCVSGRSSLCDMTWTPFRFHLSTLGVDDLLRSIYSGSHGSHIAPLLTPEQIAAPLPTLARFLNADYARHDEAGRQFNDRGEPYAFMNGHSTTTGRAGTQKRLGWFPDGLHAAIRRSTLQRQVGEILWVRGMRPGNIYGMTHHPSNTREGSYFYYGLHRTSRNLWGREKWIQNGQWAFPPERNDFGIQDLNLEHGEDLLPLVAWHTGDYALEIMTYEHAQRLMSTLQTHGIGDGGVFGGGVGMESGVNARAFWRILKDLVICHKVTKSQAILDHVLLKLDQVVRIWLPQNLGSLDTRSDTLIQGQRIPYFDVWQHSLAAWLAPFLREFGDDTQPVYRGVRSLLAFIQDQVLNAWRHVGGAWEMPKRVSAADPTFGDAYGTWHDGLVGWASAMIHIEGLATGSLEDKRIELSQHLHNLDIGPVWDVATEEL